MIEKTTNYEIFQKHPNNRDIDPNNLRKIKISIKMNNMLEIRPILVDEQMRIIDGQHRLEACKELGEPVWYQIKENSTASDILLLNEAQKKWSGQDYLDFHASQGKEAYILLKKLSQTYCLGVNSLLRLLGKSGQHIDKVFRKGNLTMSQIGSESEFKEIMQKVILLKEFIRNKTIGSKSYLDSCGFLRAAFLMISHPRVDFDLLIKKVELNIDLVGSKTKISQYQEMFKKLYNYRNPDPID